MTKLWFFRTWATNGWWRKEGKGNRNTICNLIWIPTVFLGERSTSVDVTVPAKVTRFWFAEGLCHLKIRLNTAQLTRNWKTGCSILHQSVIKKKNGNEKPIGRTHLLVMGVNQEIHFACNLWFKWCWIHIPKHSLGFNVIHVFTALSVASN